MIKLTLFLAMILVQAGARPHTKTTTTSAPTIIIDKNYKTKVLDGRESVEKFRTAHTLLYEKGIRTSQEEIRLLGIMTWELSDAGYTNNRINSFFKSNDNYNAKLLGYKDKNALDKDSTLNDKSIFNNLWR